jgi:hypothetical protein
VQWKFKVVFTLPTFCGERNKMQNRGELRNTTEQGKKENDTET